MKRNKSHVIFFDENILYINLATGCRFNQVKVKECFIVTKYPDITASLGELNIDEFFSALLSANVIEESIEEKK